MISGFLCVDKPSGITSHDVVAILRRALHQKKIGHTGTLDPFATGLLPIALGEGTKAIPYLDESIKEYQATMKLGVATDTLDLHGKVLAEADSSMVTREMVDQVVARFTGPIIQIPPMFSAIKQGGVPLYQLARKGVEVERKERPVEIHSLVIDSFELPEVTFTVRCSRGTYVRTLADDMGRELGVGAHLTALRRTVSGSFIVTGAVTIDDIRNLSPEEIVAQYLISSGDALNHLPECHVSPACAKKIGFGIAPSAADIGPIADSFTAPGRFRLFFEGGLLAVCNLVPASISAGAPSISFERVFAKG